MSDQPYAPPSSTERFVPPSEQNGDQLARRFTRLASAILDGVLMAAILLPVQYGTGYLERAMAQKVGLLEQLGISLMGVIVMFALNGYLLVTRGQTIGKMITKIQIVDVETGALLPFLRVYVFRHLWMMPLIAFIAIIPGTIDDYLLNIVLFVNALMIFGVSRRCLHDYIAGSKVVLYEENRKKLS